MPSITIITGQNTLFLSINKHKKACIIDAGFYFLHQLLAVDEEIKLKLEMFGSALAQQHTGHEYLEIFAYLAVVVVDAELECDGHFLLVHLQGGLCDGVVDSVVDVEIFLVILLHPVAANVGLVGQNHSCSDIADRDTVALIMVADGTDYGRDILCGNTHAAEDVEGHDCAGLAVLGAVYDVAYVMKPCCRHGNVHSVVIHTKAAENIGSAICYKPDVGKAVLGKVQGLHGFVLFRDIDFYFVVFTQAVEKREALFIIK